MNINKDDFKKEKTGHYCTVNLKELKGIPVSIYLKASTDFKSISVSGYAHKTNTDPIPMGTVYNFEDLNKYLCKIEYELDVVKEIATKNSTYIPILNRLAKSNLKRGHYFNEKSDDGEIQVYIEKGKNVDGKFQVFVKDKTVRDGVIIDKISGVTVSGPFEEYKDAENFAEQILIEYNTFGYYSRTVSRTKVIGLHEKRWVLKDKQSKLTEITSNFELTKEDRETLLKACEILDRIIN